MRGFNWQFFVIIVFYVVGASGAFTPFGNQLFIFTPLIITTTYALFLLSIDRKDYLVKSLIVGLFGYICEVIGVWTGFPFGDYAYGEGLFVKILEVPVVLIVNWALLSLMCYFALLRMVGKYFHIVLSAALMTFIDYLIEPVAINYDWWSWGGTGAVPLTNYIAWFIISVLIMVFYSFVFKPYKYQVYVKLISIKYVIVQILFFLTINLALWSS